MGEDSGETQILDTSDEFPTLALEITPEVVRTTKKVKDDATQLVSNIDVETQVNRCLWIRLRHGFTIIE